MLQIELCVNDTEVRKIGVINTQQFRGDQVRYEIYEMETELSEDDLRETAEIGTVWHDRSDGISQLTAAVMTEIVEDKEEKDATAGIYSGRELRTLE